MEFAEDVNVYLPAEPGLHDDVEHVAKFPALSYDHTARALNVGMLQVKVTAWFFCGVWLAFIVNCAEAPEKDIICFIEHVHNIDHTI